MKRSGELLTYLQLINLPSVEKPKLSNDSVLEIRDVCLTYIWRMRSQWVRCKSTDFVCRQFPTETYVIIKVLRTEHLVQRTNFNCFQGSLLFSCGLYNVFFLGPRNNSRWNEIKGHFHGFAATGDSRRWLYSLRLWNPEITRSTHSLHIIAIESSGTSRHAMPCTAHPVQGDKNLAALFFKNQTLSTIRQYAHFSLFLGAPGLFAKIQLISYQTK
jgi:hypothetical protein